MLGFSQFGTNVAIVAGVVVIIVWAFVFWGVVRDNRSRTPVPANLKPYLEDDVLETSRLERALQGAVILTLLLGIVLAVVFVTEPIRQKAAFEHWEERAIKNGSKIYGPTSDENGKEIKGAYGCQNCHGADGVGGVAAYTVTDAEGNTKKVQWSAPALNTVTSQFSDESLRTILVYGRPGSPMPAWGEAGGGSMTPQDIEDTIAYLKKINIGEEEAKKKNGEVGLIAGTAGSPSARYDGRELFENFCARCHTYGYSFGEPREAGSGGFGPSLAGGITVDRFPDPADMVKFINSGSKWQTPYGNGGVGQGRMPGYEKVLFPEQIQAIVDYERNLPAVPQGRSSAAATNTTTTTRP